MRSPSLKTVIFVGILLLLLLSFVSAELNKRDPQANDPEQEQPKGGKAKDPPAKEADEPPAKEADEPPAKNAKDPPAKEADEDAKNPPANGKQPDNPKQPDDAKQPPADGNKVPADQGKNSTEAPKNIDPNAPKNVDPNAPKNIDPNAPAVQVQIVEPKIAKDILYKIGQNITFRWTYSANFTSPPEYILVMSQSLINAKSFFLIKNITTFNNTEVTEAIWETAVNASILPMAKYKLWIFDENGMDGVPLPGGLQPFSNLQFGLYQPQNDEPFSCPSCIKDAATSITPLFSTIGLTLITIISFFFTLI